MVRLAPPPRLFLLQKPILFVPQPFGLWSFNPCFFNLNSIPLLLRGPFGFAVSTLFRAYLLASKLHAVAQSTAPPCVWQQPVGHRRDPRRLPVLRRPTTLPHGASVAHVPQENQGNQENQDNQANQENQVNQENQENQVNQENPGNPVNQENQKHQKHQAVHLRCGGPPRLPVVHRAMALPQPCVTYVPHPESKANTHAHSPPSPAPSSVGGLGVVAVLVSDPGVGVAGFAKNPLDTQHLSSDTIERDQTILLETADRNIHVPLDTFSPATADTIAGSQVLPMQCLQEESPVDGAINLDTPTHEKQVIQESVPPFDRVGFRRYSAAQRSMRDTLLEIARLARPQVKINWRILSRIFPQYKSVEGLAEAAEMFNDNLCDGESREDILISAANKMAGYFELAELSPRLPAGWS